jgi:superfamily II DNA or RNA helicase
MNEVFKKKLIELSESSDERLGKDVPQRELTQIIRFGAMGELGENYFLFLYRDFYRNAAYYGAVIFLEKRDRNENPVTIIGLEQNGKEQIRKVYVRTALSFLKNEFQDTMTVSGNASIVFEMAKEKINAHIGKNTPTPQEDPLDRFDFNIANQTVNSREIPFKRSGKDFKSWLLQKNLEKLEYDDIEILSDLEPGEIEEDTAPSARAKLGLCLVSRSLDLSGDNQHFFQPVIVPLNKSDKLGSPQNPLKAQLERFQWIEPPRLLEDFLDHYIAVQRIPGSAKVKVTVMRQIFFNDLAGLLFTLPTPLTFCQKDAPGAYLPLKTFKFTKLALGFAPSLEKATMLKFYLSFISADGQTLNAGQYYEIIPSRQCTYLSFVSSENENWLAAPEHPEHFQRLFQFLDAQEEFFHYELEDVLSALNRVKSEYIIIREQALKKYRLSFLPIPVLNVYPAQTRSQKDQRLEIDFDYHTPLKEFIAGNPDKEICTYERDRAFESSCLEALKNDPQLIQQMDLDKEKNAMYHFYYFRGDDMLGWLVRRGKKYLEKGFKIYSVKWKRFIGNTAGSVQVNISTGIRWLEFKPYIQDPVTGSQYEIDLENIAPDGMEDMLTDINGRLHLVTPEEIGKLTKFYRYAEVHGRIFRVPSANYILINRLYDKKMEDIPALRDILTTGEKLKKFEQIPDYPLSPNFNGQLRGYQSAGFKWLYFLRDYGFSGCLADDMGLGKTVQTLALLRTLKDNNQLNTSLLVVPVSAIPNWESEISKFSPGLTVHRHKGPNRDKDAAGWKKNDLIITSYATLRGDVELFRGFEFDYIILDEAQNIKNISSQVSKAAKILNARNRLALSGTPIENNSMELWSLFDFLSPGFLGPHRWFNRQFANPIEKEKDDAKASLLKKMIYPFILRRKKEDVETELPGKIEIVSTLDMEDDQQELYAQTARYYRDQLDAEIDENGVAGSSIKILEGMLRLRQICLFPGLVDKKFNHIPSSKFEHFKELLEDILAEGHKVLIFSQFVEVLRILKSHCDQESLPYSYIDGSMEVNARGAMIERFQGDENTRLFLLSLKAGGVALNLTAADYVVIFDPWWNPAVEAQAIDRSHRIGQTRNVMVYRMVMKDSIEQKMLELQERKKTLVDNLITSDANTFKNLRKEDILDLFKD